MVQEGVIAEIESDDFVAYVVWEPILNTDSEPSSRRAATLFPDPRVKSYWVRSRTVGELFQNAIQLRTEPAWDVYLVYRPGIVWEGDTPPEPTYYMHQLGGRLPDDRRLDGPKLLQAIDQTLTK